MNPNTEPLTRAATLRLLRIIWASLVVSVAIYGFLLLMTGRSWPAADRPVEELLQDPMVMVLAVGAIGALAMAFVMPRLIFRRGKPELRTPASPHAPVSPAVRPRFIVQWALMESVAILGLIGAFVIQDMRVFVPFGAAAALALLLAFPTEERVGRRSPEQ